MATVKIVLRKKKNKDESYPLVLRITKNRKSLYLFFNKKIHEKDWDVIQQKAKRSYPNHISLNNYLFKLRTETESMLLEYELQEKEFTLKDLRKKVQTEKKHDSVFEVAEEYFATLKEAGNFNRLSAERPAKSHLQRFLKGKDITFPEITISFLEKFKAYLVGSVKVSERTAANILIILRTLYKRAIQQGIVNEQQYPFGVNKFHIKKTESLKIGLNAEEVKRLELLELPADSFLHHARNVWLYAFYFAGMRVSEVLLSRWSDFEDDRLFYVMGKNKKPESLKVPEKATAILDQYRSDMKGPHDLVFPDLKMITDFNNKPRVQSRTKSAVRRINRALREIAIKAEITKPLTMHVARHTFGNISGDRISIQMLQKLYRHSSISTTMNYQKNFLSKEDDDALDSVLDF